MSYDDPTTVTEYWKGKLKLRDQRIAELEAKQSENEEAIQFIREAAEFWKTEEGKTNLELRLRTDELETVLTAVTEYAAALRPYCSTECLGTCDYCKAIMCARVLLSEKGGQQ